MKKSVISLAFIALISTTQAQEVNPKPENKKPETLFGSGEKLKVGGFGTPLMEWSRMNDQLVFSMGGAGAVLLNDFFIGGYGLGLTTNLEEKDAFGRTQFISVGHGGLWFGYAIPAQKLLHLHFSMKTGWGGVTRRYTRNWSNADDIFSNSFFAFTPEAGIELNVADFFRISSNLGYRFVFQDQEAVLSNNQLSGITVNLLLKFGKFY